MSFDYDWHDLSSEEKQVILEGAKANFSRLIEDAYSEKMGKVVRDEVLNILNDIWYQFCGAELWASRGEVNWEEAVEAAIEELQGIDSEEVAEELRVNGYFQAGAHASSLSYLWEYYDDAQLDIGWALEIMSPKANIDIDFIVAVARDADIAGYSEEDVKALRAMAILSKD